jgi:hypothetical protein
VGVDLLRYADLTWAGSGPPSLYAMDSQQVIHIGSFSKTLARRRPYAGRAVLADAGRTRYDGGLSEIYESL